MTDKAKEELNENEKGREGFEKGNINFEILEPGESFLKHSLRKKKEHQEGSKRGLFDLHKTKKVTKKDIVLWAVTFTVALAFLMYLFIWSETILTLFLLPVIFLVFLWSGIMFALNLARPR